MHTPLSSLAHPEPAILIQWFRSLAFLATIFLFLGIGNVTIGHYRAQNYRELLLELDSQPGPESVAAEQFGLGSQGTQEEQSSIYRDAQQRYSYYRFCILGGKCFLALSIIFFSLAIALHVIKERSVVQRSA